MVGRQSNGWECKRGSSKTSEGRLARRFLLWAGALAALLVSSFVFFPQSHKQLLEEDRTVESLTAVLFLTSVIVGCNRVIRRPLVPRWYFLVPAAGLLGLADELSFGERVFDFKMPVVSGKKIDGLHDLIDLVYETMVDRLSGATVVVLGTVVLVSLAALAVSYRAPILRAARRHPPMPYLLLLFCLLVPATMLDLSLFEKGKPQDFIEELLELNVALSLLFAAISIGADERRPVRGAP